MFVVCRARSRPSNQIGADILLVRLATLTFFFLAGFLVFLLSFLTLACRSGELGPGWVGSVPSSSDVLNTLQTRRGRRFSLCCCVLNPTSSVQSEYSLDSLNANGEKKQYLSVVKTEQIAPEEIRSAPRVYRKIK